MTTPRKTVPRKTRRTPEQIALDAKIVELRRRNLTFQQISDELGIGSAGNTYNQYKRGLADIAAEAPDEDRILLIQRYDELTRAAWKILYTPHYKVSASGKVPLHPKTGEPLVDDDIKLAAIRTINMLMKAHREIRGVDAPVVTEVRHVDNFDADIAALVARMATRGEGPATGHPEIFDMAERGETGAATT